MAKTNFDVIKVPLKGSNLIEASAGTGKTYSIAILVIRLIIEKRINLNEILMVTFTKAAVAELEVRIRKFIRDAYSYANHEKNIDKTIKTIIDNGIDKSSTDEVIELLNKARKQLDETSIFTIHSFCQKTLTEFAFETGQAFNSEVIEDEASFINEATNQYWREKITVLDAELLTFLLKNSLSKNQLVNVVSKAIRGKEFIYKTDNSLQDYNLLKEEQEKKLNKSIDLFNSTFETSYERTIENIDRKPYAANTVKAFGSLLDNAEGFMNKLVFMRETGYVKTKFPTLLQLALEVKGEEEGLKEVGRNCINYLYGEAISYCDNIIQKQKQEQSLFSFDDLINKLYNSISSESLNVAIRKKYKAIFIDEFQDTDQKQYEIFNTFFHGHSILFYIGDPKQSIYSFKATDIDTYLDAAQTVEYSYTMSKNFRSTAAYTSALNKLFSSVENPFYDERIVYERVGAGFEMEEIRNGVDVADPLSIYQCTNEPELIDETTQQVKELLMGDYQINGRKIKPSDIGILVRANRKGQEIKNILNNANIPAITIEDSRVLESEQSTLLLYLLKAMFEPNISTINRILLTYFTNKSKDDLLNLDMEADMELFRFLNQTWIEKGVFSAINAFMDRYNTLENIQIKIPNDAERISTNLLQINEILHNKENQTKSSPKDLIHWLELAIAGAEESGEYTQRLENDEDAVKIVTIHKSKGLAYNIVIAPYLDLESKYNTKWGFIEYKDPEKNKYCFSAVETEEAQRLYSEQTERENRRLIYVALTRAVYMGIIIHKPRVRCGINEFVEAAITQKHFAYKENLESDDRRYNDKKEETNKVPKTFSSTPIKSVWSNFSFSMLSQYEFHKRPEPIKLTESYDQFIFEEFPMGTLAGNFMHYLFENTDFTQTDVSAAVSRALNRYKSVFSAVNEELESSIADMLEHVLYANIPADHTFTLSQIKQENKLTEMEFNFTMDGFSTRNLQALIPNISLAREGEFQGMMTGFIDLLFEHNGKFYILDWKSNYLGNSLDFYTQENLELAMQESNYHLQYHIYTVATKIYLQNCMADFDYNTHFGGVIYVYARGCRKECNTGVFYTKPENLLIQELEKLLVEKDLKG